MGLKCNSEGRAIMHLSEGFKAHAYYATKHEEDVGLLSIGFGFTYYENGDPIKEGDTMTLEEAESLFSIIISKFEKKVEKLVTVPLNSNQFSALVSLTYNIGATKLSTSSLLRRLNSHDYKGAAEQFLVWDKQNKRVLPGLVKRRRLERELFLS